MFFSRLIWQSDFCCSKKTFQQDKKDVGRSTKRQCRRRFDDSEWDFDDRVFEIELRFLFVSAGCCKAEFDRTYPVHLNGIISQQEFHESIERINRSISSRTLLLVSIIFAIVFLLVGFILFIAGGITSVSARKTGFPILIGVAIAIFLFGMILLPVCLIFSQSKRMSELQKAILEESIKYSSRSVSPCSWRLNTNRFYTGFYNNRRVQTVYQVRSMTFAFLFFSTRKSCCSFSSLEDSHRDRPATER